MSGVSGCGIVAEGVEWADGSSTLHWLGEQGSHDSQANTSNGSLVRGIDSMRLRHEHGQAGSFIYVDTESSQEKPVNATVFGVPAIIYKHILYLAQAYLQQIILSTPPKGSSP